MICFMFFSSKNKPIKRIFKVQIEISSDFETDLLHKNKISRMLRLIQIVLVFTWIETQGFL